MRTKTIIHTLLILAVIFSVSIPDLEASVFGDGITLKRSKSSKFRKYVKVKKDKTLEQADSKDLGTEVRQSELVQPLASKSSRAVHIPAITLELRETADFLPATEKYIEKALKSQNNHPSVSENSSAIRIEEKVISESKNENKVTAVSSPSLAITNELSRKEKKQLKKEIRENLKDVKESKNAKASDTATALVGYLWLLGFLIALLAMHTEGNQFTAFHLRQSAGLMILAVILAAIGWIPIVGWIAAGIGAIYLVIAWIIGLVSALNGTQKTVPLFGEAFQNWFSGLN